MKIKEITEYRFDPGKNTWLRHERSIGFDEIIFMIEQGYEVEILPHINAKKYPHQYMFEIVVEDYVYIAPFVADGTKVFLKTLFPSRKATKQRRKRRKP